MAELPPCWLPSCVPHASSQGNFVLIYELLDEVLDHGYPQVGSAAVPQWFTLAQPAAFGAGQHGLHSVQCRQHGAELRCRHLNCSACHRAAPLRCAVLVELFCAVVGHSVLRCAVLCRSQTPPS